MTTTETVSTMLAAYYGEHWGTVRGPVGEADRTAAMYRALLASRTQSPADCEVEWVVNDIAELGVKIGDQFFFCYKGGSLTYTGEDGSSFATHDNGEPMHWRPVFKREFGECVHPINYKDPTKIGTVSLDDSDEWQVLPAAPKVGTPLRLRAAPAPLPVTITPEMVGRWASLLERYDAARDNQKDNGPDINLIIIGNYGDLALQELRAVTAALSQKPGEQG